MLMPEDGKVAERAQEGRRNHIGKCESEAVESIVTCDNKTCIVSCTIFSDLDMNVNNSLNFVSLFPIYYDAA